MLVNESGVYWGSYKSCPNLNPPVCARSWLFVEGYALNVPLRYPVADCYPALSSGATLKITWKGMQ